MTKANDDLKLDTYPLKCDGWKGAILAELVTEDGRLSLLTGGKELPLERDRALSFAIPQPPQAYASLMTMLTFLAPTICTIAKNDGVDRLNDILERSGFGIVFDIVNSDLLGGLDIRGLRASVVPSGTEDLRDGGEGTAPSES